MTLIVDFIKLKLLSYQINFREFSKMVYKAIIYIYKPMNYKLL